METTHPAHPAHPAWGDWGIVLRDALEAARERIAEPPALNWAREAARLELLADDLVETVRAFGDAPRDPTRRPDPPQSRHRRAGGRP